MKKTKKTLSMLLAMMMFIVPLAACSEETPDAGIDNTTSADSVTETTETIPAVTERRDAKDSLPADFTLNGKSFGVYLRGSRRADIWDGGEEYAGDIIKEALHNRVVAVEERLKVKFNLTATPSSMGWKDFGKNMEQNIMAGDDIWQIVFSAGNAAIQSGRDYLFQDVSGNKYLDFEQPWWFTEAIQELSLDGKQIKYMLGDISLYSYTQAAAVSFNKDIVQDNGVNPDDIYKAVLNRTWTMDKLRELSAKMYKDVNGDGIVNDGDRYGLYLTNAEQLRKFQFCVGLTFSSRNPEGYHVYEVDVERATRAVDAINTLIYGTVGNGYSTSGKASFTGGTTVFTVCTLLDPLGATYRDMEAEYGLIPLPMLDEAQKEYTTLIGNSAEYVTIPVTCANPDETGAVIEALCSESYRSVIEPFYEQALKTKYTRDSYSGQCIDIIRSAARKDFIYEYNWSLGGGAIIWKETQKNSNNFASLYAAERDVVNNKIIQLVERYTKAEG